MKKLFAILAVALLAVSAANADPIGTSDSSWNSSTTGTGTAVLVTTPTIKENGTPGGNGSLMLDSQTAASSVTAIKTSELGGNLGFLAGLLYPAVDTLSFKYYLDEVSASTTLSVALTLFGSSKVLTWSSAYDGSFNSSLDTWLDTGDLTANTNWRLSGSGTTENTLADWWASFNSADKQRQVSSIKIIANGDSVINIDHFNALFDYSASGTGWDNKSKQEYYTDFNFYENDVPEPATMALFGLAAFGVVFMRRRSVA